LANGEFLKTALARPVVKAASRGETVVLFPVGEHTQRQPAEAAALRRALRQLADRSRVERPAGHAQVRVELKRGHASEELWLKIVRSRKEKLRGDEFFAELIADSRLWPFLRTGERLKLDGQDVLEVRGVDSAAGPCR